MKTLKMILFTTLTGPIFLTGCSLIDIRPPTNINNSPASKQKIFFAHYDNVWRAAHASLKFPIAQENQDTGIIETEHIKGIDGWLPPGTIKPPSSGVRYKLIITLAKGITDGRDSTRLTIEKKIEILKNFFSMPEPIESDGLEESVLFYRIERELIIIDALKKAN
jgi:hypothetical protein